MSHEEDQNNHEIMWLLPKCRKTVKILTQILSLVANEVTYKMMELENILLPRKQKFVYEIIELDRVYLYSHNYTEISVFSSDTSY